LVPQGGQVVTGRVIKRKRDSDGNLIGKSHQDPLLDTSLYEVELEDGRVEAFSANLIAESMYEQVDDEGAIQRIVDEIVDHKRMGDAIHSDDNYDSLGNQRKTTKGWKLCIRWKDGSTSWERLATMKDGYPIETSEYAVANKLVSEPAFSWWVPQVLKTRERTIAKLNTRYLRREDKFGIQLPKTVREALKQLKKR
jgi:hypothetical protein